jgi:hypothetical protein
MNNFYVDRPMAIQALRRMKSFHEDLKNVMSNYEIDLTSNLGRRNILMSQAQEIFFANEIGKKFKVTSSGKTGEPDITIVCLGRELECKITSPSKTGSISFQTDYDTLLKKEKVDYLYIVANEEFNKFAALHYTDLNVCDFGALRNGSRGKVQMLKHQTCDRLNCLVGGLKSLNQENLNKLQSKIEYVRTPKQKIAIQKSIDYWTNTPSKYSIILEEV